ncbi:hypothetical protein D3C76_1139820 [compost metagenome]
MPGLRAEWELEAAHLTLNVGETEKIAACGSSYRTVTKSERMHVGKSAFSICNRTLSLRPPKLKRFCRQLCFCRLRSSPRKRSRIPSLCLNYDSRKTALSLRLSLACSQASALSASPLAPRRRPPSTATHRGCSVTGTAPAVNSRQRATISRSTTPAKWAATCMAATITIAPLATAISSPWALTWTCRKSSAGTTPSSS